MVQNLIIALIRPKNTSVQSETKIKTQTDVIFGLRISAKSNFDLNIFGLMAELHTF